METNLSPGRWRQIAIANFDYYVYTRLTEPSWIVTSDGIDKRELGCLAKSAECDSDKLRSVIVASLLRTNKNCKLALGDIQEQEDEESEENTNLLDSDEEEDAVIPISEDEEDEIIKAIIKLNIKESIVSLVNVRRKLGKMPRILNHQNTDLKTTVQELGDFIRPLYQEVITETLVF